MQISFLFVLFLCVWCVHAHEHMRDKISGMLRFCLQPLMRKLYPLLRCMFFRGSIQVFISTGLEREFWEYYPSADNLLEEASERYIYIYIYI